MVTQYFPFDKVGAHFKSGYWQFQKWLRTISNNPQDKERKVEFKTEQGVCSRGLWVQLKCPCVHAIAANNALKFKNTVESWYQYAFAPAYLLKSYELAFGETNPDIVPPLIGSTICIKYGMQVKNGSI